MSWSDPCSKCGNHRADCECKRINNMETLNLEKLWELCNRLSDEQDVLAEEDKFISFLGNRSNYSTMSFEDFLEYYSFKVTKDTVVVFNDDGVPYENYTVGDFSYIPFQLLSFSEAGITRWINDEIIKQTKQQEKEKLQRKEGIKEQIKLLQKQLEKL